MTTPREKLYALIESEGMTSVMNDTRWREVLLSLRGIDLSYRVKLLSDPDPSQWNDLPYGHIPLNCIEPHEWGGPILLLHVEWLEINTIESKWRGQLVDPEAIDHSVELIKILTSLKVPFALYDGVIRIYGHFRPS